MDPKEITERLLRGSHNMDRMKEETHQVVSMVIGYIHDQNLKLEEVRKTFDSDSIQWRISLVEGDLWHPARLRVRCLVKVGDSYLTGYDDHPGRPSASHQCIQAAYEGLPVFVGGMLKAFPHLEVAWQPLIKASKVKFY